MSDWRRDLLTFWFGLTPEQWWKSDPSLDDECRRRFLETWTEQRTLPVRSFTDDPLTALAAVILFDQMPRNMFRGLADAYATDHLALGIAREAVNRDFDRELSVDERNFLYMPFQHSEDLNAQKRSVQLYTALGSDYYLGYAKKHHDVVAKFGRFPHRNKVLGRALRPAEAAAGDVFPW
jgi:uncharacterized protein (DUF924 family)